MGKIRNTSSRRIPYGFLVLGIAALVLCVLIFSGLISLDGKTETSAVPCQSLLSDGDSQTPPLPFSCIAHIGKDAGDVRFVFEPEGRIEAYRGARRILSVPLSDNGSAIGKFVDGRAEELAPSAFSLEDVTYDGYADFMVLTGSGAYNWIYDYYAYDSGTQAFSPRPILIDAYNPLFDKNARMIESFAKSRGAGDIYVRKHFHFENGAYTLVYRETQDMVYGTGGEQDGYERVIEQLRDGVVVETKRELLTEGEHPEARPVEDTSS